MMALPGRPFKRLLELILTGNPTDPDSKGLISSKTGIFGTLGTLLYPIGLQAGWWDVADWEALGVPLIGWLGTLWGRITAKKKVG